MYSEDRSVFDLPYIQPKSSLSYGNNTDQVIDFYLPGATNNPIIVLIHGGYWRPDYDRKHLAPLAQKFADSGWPVALIEYRRIIGNPDAAMVDVISAIEEVAGKYKSLILIGHSAGGHLALLAANKFNVLGVVALAPVTDLAKTEELDLDEGAVSDFLGAPASFRVDLDPMRLPMPIAPTIVIHGVLDIRVPIEFSRSYVARSENINTRLLELDGIGHFELIDPRSDIFEQITDFLTSLI